LEVLEDRTLLATRIWDGGGPDLNWTTAANWVGDVVPSSADDLVRRHRPRQQAGTTNTFNPDDLPVPPSQRTAWRRRQQGARHRRLTSGRVHNTVSAGMG
jgi:hypothetical protein